MGFWGVEVWGLAGLRWFTGLELGRVQSAAVSCSVSLLFPTKSTEQPEYPVKRILGSLGQVWQSAGDGGSVYRGHAGSPEALADLRE